MTDRQPIPVSRRAAGVCLGLILIAGGTVVVSAASAPSVDDQVEALYDKYEKLAESTSPGPEQTALNEQFEEEFAAIGTEAPNGPNPSLAPEEYEPNTVPNGIHDAVEDPKGYVLTNLWSGVRDGAPIWVGAASLVDDRSVIGVYVFDERGPRFISAPTKGAHIRIVNHAEGTLSLTSEDGASFTFSIGALEFER